MTPGFQGNDPVQDFAYSVLMPAYNSAATITDAIASALAQTLPPRAVIVVDDGSSDDTATRARSAGAQVTSQPRGGTATARNRGLQAVATPFVATLDADDTWGPRMAETHAKAWAELGEAVAATGARLRPVGPLAGPAWQPRGPHNHGPVRPVSAEELWLANPFPCSATMLRTDALREVHGWVSLFAVEDYDLLIRLWAAGRDLVRIPVVLGTYQVSAAQTTAAVARALVSERTAVSMLYESQRRRVELPGANLDARLRRAWWQAAARCANYEVPLSTLPSIAEYGAARNRLQKAAGWLVKKEVIGRLTALGWRRVGWARSILRRRSDG